MLTKYGPDQVFDLNNSNDANENFEQANNTSDIDTESDESSVHTAIDTKYDYSVKDAILTTAVTDNKKSKIFKQKLIQF